MGFTPPFFSRGRPDPYLGRRAFGTHAPPFARAIDGTHNVPNGARGLGAQSPKPEGNAVKKAI